ncbi:MAG: hypothetical protein ABR556_14195, partial [Pyrinomonadaceae bacterium]
GVVSFELNRETSDAVHILTFAPNVVRWCRPALPPDVRRWLCPADSSKIVHRARSFVGGLALRIYWEKAALRA